MNPNLVDPNEMNEDHSKMLSTIHENLLPPFKEDSDMSVVSDTTSKWNNS